MSNSNVMYTWKNNRDGQRRWLCFKREAASRSNADMSGIQRVVRLDIRNSVWSS